MAQLAGGVAGAVLVNLMYELPALELGATERSGAGVVIAEVVATVGLVAPGSAPPFLAAQALGGLVDAALVLSLYPDVAAAEDDVVVPHDGPRPHTRGDRS